MSGEKRHVLYRFYADGGQLLYVGITHRIGARFAAHRGASSWYDLADNVTLKRYPTRAAVLRAEKTAIKAERPRYNIVHNERPARRLSTPGDPQDVGRWYIESVHTGYTRKRDLYLYPELSRSPMIDDFCDQSGAHQLAEYVDCIRAEESEWWEEDAVPIYWSVRSAPHGVYESAPFQGSDPSWIDFLTDFRWPYDDDGERLDWFTLPVRDARDPKFAAALNWTPSPLQQTCPLRSIVQSRARSILIPEFS